MKQKPRLSFWQIWNMSFGFLGIQFGFALQNANASRILQTFGADVHHLSWFWLVAPITGMIVQPIVGYMSDRTWNRFGRRRPYFLVGAFLTSAALILMPNAPHLATFIAPMFIGGGLLMIMDASINISMEPFRALVADKLPDEQHTLGFSMQTLLIGIGAVVGSWLPYILGNWFGVPTEATGKGLVPPNVAVSFYFGAAVLLGSIIWTVTSTKEYPPDFYREEGETEHVKTKIKIPKTMWQLLLVQFFSWFALVLDVGIYHTCGRKSFFGTTDANSTAYQEAGNWVGILFGVYNGVSAIIALFFRKLLQGSDGEEHMPLHLPSEGFLISFYIIPTHHLLNHPDDRNWDSLGKYSCHALCDAGKFYSAKANGDVYGIVQYVNHRSADRERNFRWTDIALYL